MQKLLSLQYVRCTAAALVVHDINHQPRGSSSEAICSLSWRLSWRCACEQETDNPDLRDRAYVYWRLLSSDPEAARAVVLAEKPVISQGTATMDPQLLSTLLGNLSTLASVYHLPPSVRLCLVYVFHASGVPLRTSLLGVNLCLEPSKEPPPAAPCGSGVTVMAFCLVPQHKAWQHKTGAPTSKAILNKRKKHCRPQC